jgi:hypothetical protein
MAVLGENKALDDRQEKGSNSSSSFSFSFCLLRKQQIFSGLFIPKSSVYLLDHWTTLTALTVVLAFSEPIENIHLQLPNTIAIRINFP